MRKWIGIGLVLIAIGVAGLLSPWSNWRSDWVERVEVNERHQVDADGIKRLSIETDSEDVRVVEGTQGDIIVRVEGKVSARYGDKNKLNLDVSDGTLNVRTPRESIQFGYMVYHLKITIEMPPAAYESIAVETDSGDIELQGLAFGDMKLESDSGDMAIAQMRSNTIHVQTDSGDVGVTDTEGALVADSDSGDMVWKGPRLVWAAEVKSDSGDVAFRVGEKPDNATIHFTSDSGDGLVEWGGSMADSGKTIKEVYGGGSPLIRIDTDSGDFVMTNG